MSANGIGPAAAYPYVVSLDIQEVQLMIPDFTTSSSFFAWKNQTSRKKLKYR